MRLDLSFILVEPAHAQNIGAAARALKTMGFRRLILVNPACHPSEEARFVAHGSQDILDEARVVPSLAALRPEFDWLVIATKEGRHLRTPNVPLAQLGEHLHTRQIASSRIGIVFGREAYGLSNDEIHLGDVTSSIPLAAAYPALNLGQCVMLYAHTLASIQENLPPAAAADFAADEYRAFYQRISGFLHSLGLEPGKKAYDQSLSRLAALSFKDMRLLQHLLDRIETMRLPVDAALTPPPSNKSP